MEEVEKMENWGKVGEESQRSENGGGWGLLIG